MNVFDFFFYTNNQVLPEYLMLQDMECPQCLSKLIHIFILQWSMLKTPLHINTWDKMADVYLELFQKLLDILS